MNKKAHSTLALYRYFFRAYKQRSAVMIALMALAGVAEGVGVITLIPVLEFAAESSTPVESGLGSAVQGLLNTLHLPAGLGVLLTMIVIAIALKAVFLFFAQRQVGFTVAGVTRDLRLQVLRSLFEVQWSFFGQRSIGQFHASVIGEAQRSATAYGQACALIASLLQMLAYLIVATLLSWRVALVALVAGSGLLMFGRHFIGKSRAAGQAQTVGIRAFSIRLLDVLQGIKPIRAMGRQEFVWPLLNQEAEQLNLATRSQVSASESLKAFQEPFLTVLLALGMFVVLSRGDVPLSSMLVMAFIFYRLMVHINTLQFRYQMMVVGESAFSSLWEGLSVARAHPEPVGGSREFCGLKEGIRLEEVHFAHDGKPVLSGVNVMIPAGEFVAIHGESGSGKTTLADLVVGLYQPDKGRILLDGVPLHEFELASWRCSIGYVLQESLLFDESVFMNVTLGDPMHSREDAERALRMAGAWDFVSKKEKGLDHQIGERGGIISGGERQRIALARALIDRPALLILDEATTALDPATEQAICDTLRTLSGEVTIVSISHQTSMRAAADTTYAMNDGRLVLFAET